MRRWAVFVLWLVGFFAVWTAWVLWGYPHLAKLGTASLAYVLIGLGVRLAIWVAPIWLYLTFIEGVSPVAFLCLSSNWQRGAAIGLIIGLINFGMSALLLGEPRFDPTRLTWNTVLSTSLAIGFVEETVFRGFVMQKLAQGLPTWVAIIASSFLFTAIHLPGWLSLQLFDWGVVGRVFVLGVVLALALTCARSLWAPIVAHNINDMLAAVVFRA